MNFPYHISPLLGLFISRGFPRRFLGLFSRGAWRDLLLHGDSQSGGYESTCSLRPICRDEVRVQFFSAISRACPPLRPRFRIPRKPGLAVATQRRWIIATDETKDRRLSREIAAKGIKVIDTPGILLKAIRSEMLSVRSEVDSEHSERRAGCSQAPGPPGPRPVFQPPDRGIRSAHDLESVQRVHKRVQGTRPHPAVQGNRQAGSISCRRSRGVSVSIDLPQRQGNANHKLISLPLLSNQ